MSFNEWEEVRLESCTNIIFSGGTPSTKNKNYWGGEYPWLSSGETRNNRITTTERTITLEGINNSSTKLAKIDDIVIASAGQGHTRGQASLCRIDTYINQSIISIRSKKDILNPQFLFYNIKGRYAELRQISDGHSIRGSLTTNMMKDFKIKIPPLNEQKAIAHILSTLDEKIETNNKINQRLEEIAQTIFKHWFIDFEFPNENGDPYKSSGGEMVESELGMIPKGWEVKKLDDIIELHDSKRIPLSKNEREKREKIYPYYGAASLMDYVDEYIFDGIYVLLGEDGTVMDEFGYPILQYVWGKFWVNNHAHVLTGKEGLSINFIYVALQNINVAGAITGAVQMKINQKNLKELKVVLPNELEIIERFSEIINISFVRIRSNSDENQALTQLRDTLIPKLMSGELRAPLEDDNI